MAIALAQRLADESSGDLVEDVLHAHVQAVVVSERVADLGIGDPLPVEGVEVVLTGTRRAVAVLEPTGFPIVEVAKPQQGAPRPYPVTPGECRCLSFSVKGAARRAALGDARFGTLRTGCMAQSGRAVGSQSSPRPAVVVTRS